MEDKQIVDLYWARSETAISETEIKYGPNKLSTFLGKITRNLSLNRWELYNTEKRGPGKFYLLLMNCMIAFHLQKA